MLQKLSDEVSKRVVKNAKRNKLNSKINNLQKKILEATIK